MHPFAFHTTHIGHSPLLLLISWPPKHQVHSSVANDWPSAEHSGAEAMRKVGNHGRKKGHLEKKKKKKIKARSRFVWLCLHR